MKKAFNYMFLDNKFYTKATIFCIYIILLLYCSIFACNGIIPLKFPYNIILILFVLFGHSVSEGYKITIIKSTMNIDEKVSILPIINLKKNFIIGIKYLIALLIFSIPFYFVIGAFGFTVGFATMLNMPIVLINLSNILLIISTLVYLIYLICFLPATILIYANSNSIWSFYKFNEIFKLFAINKKEYVKTVLIYYILGIIMEECYRISLIMCNKNIVLLCVALLLSGYIITYLIFVTSFLIARINKNQ